MNRNEARNELNGATGFFRHWIGLAQRQALLAGLRGDEGDFFADMLTKLKERIESMPKGQVSAQDRPNALQGLSALARPGQKERAFRLVKEVF